LLQRSIAFDVVELLPAHASAIAINIGHESALSLVVDARLVITVQVHYNLPTAAACARASGPDASDDAAIANITKRRTVYVVWRIPNRPAPHRKTQVLC
jgi:hypothetical protein